MHYYFLLVRSLTLWISTCFIFHQCPLYVQIKKYLSSVYSRVMHRHHHQAFFSFSLAQVMRLIHMNQEKWNQHENMIWRSVCVQRAHGENEWMKNNGHRQKRWQVRRRRRRKKDRKRKNWANWSINMMVWGGKYSGNELHNREVEKWKNRDDERHTQTHTHQKITKTFIIWSFYATWNASYKPKFARTDGLSG